MQTEIVRIGNSKGVRIPAYILKECNIKDRIELEVRDGKIIITPVDRPREGWSEKFKKMHKNDDDKCIIDDNIGLEAGDWEW